MKSLSPEAVLKYISLGLLLGIAIVWLLGRSHWQAPEPILPEPGALQVVPPKIPVYSAIELTAMLERPLLWPERRPEIIAEVKIEPKKIIEEDPFKDLKILGVYGQEGNVAGGIILKYKGKNRRIRLNEYLDDTWRLAEVSEDKAVFINTKHPEVREILLQRSTQPKKRSTCTSPG